MPIMSKSKGSPRKFAEKIALLNKKEAEANAEFEKIIKEVEETTRVSPSYPTAASISITTGVGVTGGTGRGVSGSLGNTSNSWFQSELHYVESLQPACAFGAPVPPANGRHDPNTYHLVSHQPYQTTNSNNNATTTTTSNSTTSNSMSPINHYSNCRLDQQHQQSTLAAPQDILIEDSLSPPSVATNASIPNIKVHLTSDDNNGSYQQVHQDVSPRHSPQPQLQHQQQNLQHMTCLGSSPISVARSLPDIANLRVSTSLSTMAPSYSDHQLPIADDYNYDYDYDANSNIVQTSSSPNYYPENNNSPQLDTASCQHSNATSAATDYNNYRPIQTNAIQSNVHQPNHSTQNTTNYYPTNNNHHNHQCSTNLAQMNRANSTSIVHRQSGKPLNCEEDFLIEPRVSNGLSRSTEACYDTTQPFGYDTYETRNPLSQYNTGCGPQRKLRSSSYNNLGSINSHHHHHQHHQTPTQIYSHQPQQTTVTEQVFVPNQQFYN